MTDTSAVPPVVAPSRQADPVVRPISIDDISLALAAGLRDFKASPSFGLFFGAATAAMGLAMMIVAVRLELVFLAYPMVAGFALVAPLAAVGLYETSRRLERGEPASAAAVAAAIAGHGRGELGFMALVALFGLMIWIYAAGFLYAIFFGLEPLSFPALVTAVTTTPRGAVFFLVGNLVGAAIAVVLFALSVVSYPLLVDRDIDFVTAMITSIRAFAASPGPMIGWGIFLATLTGLAVIPMFLGLVVVLPVLGHATWHLYRRAIEPERSVSP